MSDINLRTFSITVVTNISFFLLPLIASLHICYTSCNCPMVPEFSGFLLFVGLVFFLFFLFAFKFGKFLFVYFQAC
jgi:hypothetical protein